MYKFWVRSLVFVLRQRYGSEQSRALSLRYAHVYVLSLESGVGLTAEVGCELTRATSLRYAHVYVLGLVPSIGLATEVRE
jgi:hypothetical protein